MADERAERCGRCRYWDALPEDDALAGNGLCRRHAPRARLIEPHTDFDPLPLWPATHPGDWCGEFAPAFDASLPRAAGGYCEHDDLVSLLEGIGVRTEGALHRAGIRRVGQLVTWDARSLLGLPDFGPHALAEVCSALAARGLALRSEAPPVDTTPPVRPQ